MSQDNDDEETMNMRESSTMSVDRMVDDEEETQRPSNEKLLCTAFVSFMGFAIAEVIVAFISGSEALMGDAAAMVVDALTYLFNWQAEKQKQLYQKQLNQHRPTGRSSLEYKKYTYQLELIPPLVSVITLLLVTGFVLNKAVRVLILDSKRDVSLQARPNVHLMLLFSCLNLLLDCLNVFCFAKAKHAMGYETHTDAEHELDELLQEQATTMRSLLDFDEVGSRESDDCLLDPEDQEDDDDEGDHEEIDLNDDNEPENHKKDDEKLQGSSKSKTKKPLTPLEIESSSNGVHHHDDDHHHHDHSNLNMCSAYTHVFADTLRSFAVIIAAILAEVIPGVTSEEADASAAVVVSILIGLSLIPLFNGMVETYHALQRVNALLRQEEEGLELFSYDEDDEELYSEDDEEN